MQKDHTAMAEQPTSRGDFRAAMREVEPGVFRAEYLGEWNPDDPDARAFPDSHLGTSRDDVKIWVEQMARALGYQRVVWEPPTRQA
jgi:hypothetical protein